MSRKEWNRTAENFKELVCDITAEEMNDQLRLFVNAAHPSRDKSVLADLGCGIGTFVQKFSDRFSRVFAADFATDAIRQAESGYKGTTPAEWHVADLTECPRLFGTSCADLTACLNVITSPSAARRKSLWETVRTITKPAGATDWGGCSAPSPTPTVTCGRSRPARRCSPSPSRHTTSGRRRARSPRGSRPPPLR